jgi:alpha/beta superfamily hydrolase
LSQRRGKAAVSAPPRSKKHFLQGPAGRLQALYELPGDREPHSAAVICHPHPLHGGTLHNKVAHTLARAFVRQGFAALRFNFRGVEESDGHYDEARGELDDALAALDWMFERHPRLPLWVAGFSFGAAIAIRAATVRPVVGLVSVAPAVKRFADGLERQPQCPWLIVQGDEDELVDADETIEWVNGLEPGPELQLIKGAEHFFHGRLNLLREAVSEFVRSHADNSKTA